MVGDPTALQRDATQASVVFSTSLPPTREVVRRMSPTRASWLLFLPTERLTDHQREQRERVRACHPEVEAAYQLVSAFVRMLAERRGQDLECWLRQATHSQLPELKRFARGVLRDEAAVRAAFSSGISNGQTEGQVNKLKVLKRSMYGRANFDLLRLRFLYRAVAAVHKNVNDRVAYVR
jgi:transposase